VELPTDLKAFISEYNEARLNKDVATMNERSLYSRKLRPGRTGQGKVLRILPDFDRAQNAGHGSGDTPADRHQLIERLRPPS